MKIKIINILLLIILGSLPLGIYAQFGDMSISYSQAMKLNPALTGFGYKQAAHLYYRQKGIANKPLFYLMHASYAQNFAQKRMSLGLMVESHQTQGHLLSHNNIALSYAYRLPLNQHSYIQMALQAAFFQRSLHWEGLTFADQYNTMGELVYPSAEQAPAKQNYYYADFSAGWAILWQNKWVIGTSLAHLTQPHVGFYKGKQQTINMHIKAHISTVFLLIQGRKQKPTLTISPHFIYQQQKKNKQFQLGIYLNVNPVVIAAWYRQKIANSKTLGIMLGVNYKNITFACVYDIALSAYKYMPLQAHALQITYVVRHLEKRRRHGQTNHKNPIPIY